MYSFIDSLKFLYGGLFIISTQFIEPFFFLSLTLTVYIQIKQKMYQSIPYTAQIPAGTSFPDRRNLPYSLVGLFSCCETNYSERKGNNPASN